MPISKFLNPKNDVAFKKIFGSEKNKDILIHFINDVLKLQGEDTIESVEFLSPVQDPEIAAKKQSIVDVLCRDIKGIQIIVEMQASPQQGFEKRAQYYAAKAYTRQLNQGQGAQGRYHHLKAVIFIAISDYTLFPDKSEYWSEHRILDQNSLAHDLQDFHFVFLELSKFKKTEIDQLRSMVEKWCYFFKYGENTTEQQVMNITGKTPVIGRAYEALNQFNWTEKELIAYEQEVKRVMDNIAAEDYIKTHALQEGREKGLAQGLEKGLEKGLRKGLEKGLRKGLRKGIQEGMEKGRKTEQLHIAKNMLLQLQLDINAVAQATGLSLAELQQLKEQ